MTGAMDKVIQLRKGNPCLTSAKIGRMVGISRQRVFQILRREGLATVKVRNPRTCEHCGCPCLGGQNRFCSHQCFHAHTYAILICEACGKEFERRARLLIHQLNTPNSLTGRQCEHIFCSRRCLGTWTGKTYGLGNPGHPMRKLQVQQRLLNQQREFCKHGHSMTDAYITKTGSRLCRTCHKIYEQTKLPHPTPRHLGGSKRKEFCKRGHPLSEAYITKTGGRLCRQCNTLLHREAYKPAGH